MNDFIGILVVIVSIVCMLMAQRQSIPRGNRSVYALLGSVASIMIAVEAAQRSEPGVMILFAAAALVSVLGLIMDYLKPTNPDA